MGDIVHLANYRDKKLGDDIARLIEYLVAATAGFNPDGDMYMRVRNQEDGVVLFINKRKET